MIDIYRVIDLYFQPGYLNFDFTLKIGKIQLFIILKSSNI